MSHGKTATSKAPNLPQMLILRLQSCLTSKCRLLDAWSCHYFDFRDELSFCDVQGILDFDRVGCVMMQRSSWIYTNCFKYWMSQMVGILDYDIYTSAAFDWLRHWFVISSVIFLGTERPLFCHVDHKNLFAERCQLATLKRLQATKILCVLIDF